MKYNEFIDSKKISDTQNGLKIIPPLNEMLFQFQSDIVKWALKRGRACVFADCGMGKTPIQLEWAKHIDGNVLIVAPLAVSHQTIIEGEKFGVHVDRSEDGTVKGHITITNYEKLHKFKPADYQGIVLDESSIIKSFNGKFRNDLIENWCCVPYRLACTATPAPNDFMELGNHAEFVGTMTRTEMLSMFFVHDGGDTSKWRIKGHAQDLFWKWVCSWAVMIRMPSDLGYDDGGFVLPALHMHEHVVKISQTESCGEFLFRMPASTLQERQRERKYTIEERAKCCADIVNSIDEQCLIWCNLNTESDTLCKMIEGALEVAGKHKDEVKAERLLGFGKGKFKALVTKPKIASFGLNWQSCHHVFFVGLSDSYEQYYQAIRRCWRFGQMQEVHCHIITAETEGAVVANIKRKEKDSKLMAAEMVKHMHVYNEENIRGTTRTKGEYKMDTIEHENYKLMMGDSCERIKEIPDDSVGLSVFSPPFASLYTYSNSDRDMGNCKTHSEFYTHFEFLAVELFRVMQSGRNVSFHCMNLPTSKTRDGYIGISDFRGDLIRIFQNAGFIYHSEVCIWKNPVVAMQRTKALGLLHKQVKKDSCMSRQGIPDYLVTMRKPGTNKKPVAGEFDHFAGDDTFTHTGNLSIDVWQRYASPVWMDINPSNTLQKQSAREQKDERHICPLQLEVIERACQLWSLEGDTVFSPFMGIGSEGFVAVKNKRKFIGIELKESYYKQACKNIEIAYGKTKEIELF